MTEEKNTLKIVGISLVVASLTISVVAFIITLVTNSNVQKTAAMHNVSFRNYDSAIISSQSVADGEVAKDPELTPVRPADSSNTYTFDGWDKSIADTPITEDTTFVAQYNVTPIVVVAKYLVRFYNDDDTLLFSEQVESGSVASLSGIVPTKEATAEASYKFAGWDKDATVAITEATDFKAKYDTYYQATFLDSDNTFLDRIDIKKDAVPSIDLIPTKATANLIKYAFDGWKEKETGTASAAMTMTKNLTFVAHYSQISISSPLSDFILTPDDETNPTYYTVTEYNGSDQVVSIPRTASDGKPITHIGNSAFQDCLSLTTIYGASIIEIDDALTYGDSPFDNCLSLNYVYFEFCTKIGSYAFNGCANLEKITFPRCESIGEYAFNSCYSLDLSENSYITAKTIGAYAFSNCTAITTVASTFDELQTIGNGAFASCTNLTNFSFGKDGTGYSVGIGAFSGCKNLKEFNTNKVVYLGSSAFMDCSSLKLANMDYVSTIPTTAFKNCSSLVEFSGLHTSSIDSEAFYGCYSLQKITLMSSCITVSNSFTGATLVNTIILDSYDIHSNLIQNITVSASGDVAVNCSASTTSNYISITNNTFKNVVNLSNYVVSKPVRTFGNYSFDGSGIRSLPLLDATCIFGECAFRSCTRLKTIDIRNATTTVTINKSAFAGIGYVTSLMLPTNISFGTSSGATEQDAPFYGDTFGSVTFSGTIASFNNHINNYDSAYGGAKIFPVGTLVSCFDGTLTIS